jgi:hypothetical protein
MLAALRRFALGQRRTRLATELMGGPLTWSTLRTTHGEDFPNRIGFTSPCDSAWHSRACMAQIAMINGFPTGRAPLRRLTLPGRHDQPQLVTRPMKSNMAQSERACLHLMILVSSQFLALHGTSFTLTVDMCVCVYPQTRAGDVLAACRCCQCAERLSTVCQCVHSAHL